MLRDADLDPVPTPAALARAPELAALALLERALDVSRYALIAAHPELHACLDDYPRGLPWDAQARCAAALIGLADRLQVVLHTYYRVLLDANGPAAGADEVPF
ncbi:MAG: hypothetical protein MUF56_08720 [Solirubrobacteraceae bacterium]|jgi:hypothetical protein|nr:hypothetical protein [Vicinamibacterales bacterium]MCU0259089.1 hypothetical protein [Solirubrobacteraceae bacterium]